MKVRRRIREGVILLAVFIAAVFVFSLLINRDSENTTADIGTATYPQVAFSYNGYTLNPLPGYAKEMDIPSMRDTITPITDGEVSVSLLSYDNEITSLSYQVYSLDGQTLLSEGTMEHPEEDLTLTFGGDWLSEGEQVLVLTLDVAELGPVYYYTRILDAEDANLLICLDYIYDFHESAISKNADSAISTALETGNSGSSTDYGHVTIHSDYEQVTWGELDPNVSGSVRWNITEMNGAYISVRLEYLVDCTGEENETDEYRVQEFFRVRYQEAKGETYLLDYDRTMDQIFNTTHTVLDEDSVILGITDGDVPYLTDEESTMVAFVQADELWCYDRTSNTFSKVFSFVSSEGKDARDFLDMNQIQLLDMDEDGNVTFAVCGYMNRGAHEGEVGVAIYYFDESKNVVTEKVFVDSDRSPGYAELELGSFLYYSMQTDTLYLFMDGTLYEVDVSSEWKHTLVEGLNKGEYVVSEDGSRFAYQKAEEGEAATRLVLKNFETGKERTIDCESDETVTPLGFIDHDFAYGTARLSDAGETVSGEKVTPMYKVEIQNSEGEIVKTYQEDRIYILGAQIDDQMITLSRVTKKGSVYTDTTDEYIMSNSEQGESSLVAETYATELKATQTRLTFPEKVPDKSPRLLNPQLVIGEDPVMIDFENTLEEERYYVYGMGKLQGICEQAGEAVRLADDCDGVVVTSAQAYVWQRGNRDLEYEIPTDSAALSTIKSGMKKGTSPMEIMEQLAKTEVLDLTGCTTEEILYVIDQGTPVIAMTDADNGVILVGYSDYLVVYEDPETGERTSVTYSTMDDMTESSGHTFVGAL